MMMEEPDDEYLAMVARHLRDLELGGLRAALNLDSLDVEELAWVIAPFMKQYAPNAPREWLLMALNLCGILSRYEEVNQDGEDEAAPQTGYPEERISANPPPVPKPAALNRSEIDWLLRRASGLPVAEREGWVCCVATLLPYFKAGSLTGDRVIGIPRKVVEAALVSAWPNHPVELQAMPAKVGLISHVAPGGLRLGEEGGPVGYYSASYTLTDEVPFSEEPQKLPEPGPTVRPSLRYTALRMLAKGQDWRPTVGHYQPCAPREPLQLSAVELVQLRARFENAPTLGAAAAMLMPRLKFAQLSGHPYCVLSASAVSTTVELCGSLDKLINSTDLFEEIPEQQNPTLLRCVRVRTGAFDFSPEVPRRSLHPRGEASAKAIWAGVLQATAGL